MIARRARVKAAKKAKKKKATDLTSTADDFKVIMQSNTFLHETQNTIITQETVRDKRDSRELIDIWDIIDSIDTRDIRDLIDITNTKNYATVL